jgi:hypothetical protein
MPTVQAMTASLPGADWNVVRETGYTRQAAFVIWSSGDKMKEAVNGIWDHDGAAAIESAAENRGACTYICGPAP